MKAVQTGIECLYAAPPAYLAGKRLGLLANPASVDSRFRHSRRLIDHRFPGQLTALFSPQHGFFAEKQDNMILSADRVDPVLNIPIFSLYGETRQPNPSMLDLIDTLIIDLQDVGTRVYTFIYTMALCMQAAARQGKQVVVLDRPNPIGGTMVEGNMVQADLTSFVGMYPIPMRHGLTIGELALLFNTVFGIGCNLEIVKMRGWMRHWYFSETGLPWIPPSPNLPTAEAATVYPGQVIWEATNISEGRGTTQPFEIFGAPFIAPEEIEQTLGNQYLAGIHLRPIAFEPTSNKWRESLCYGFQLHVLDRHQYRPYISALAILKAVHHLYPERLAWKPPPYEFEYEKRPFDLITGDRSVRETIERNGSLNALGLNWEKDLKRFDEMRKAVFLYR